MGIDDLTPLRLLCCLAVTAGYTTDATDDAVQANIVAAGYGQ